MIGEDGVPVRAHEGPMDPGTWWKVQEVLDTPSTAPRGGGRGAPLTLLSHLTRCGRCGGQMAGQRKAPAIYRCSRASRGEGCPGVQVSMAPLEDYVVRAVVTRLGTLDLEDTADMEVLVDLGRRWTATRRPVSEVEVRELTATIHELEAALERLDDDRASGAFPGDDGRRRYLRQVGQLTERMDTARMALDELRPPEPDLGVLLDIRQAADDLEGDPIGPGSAWAGLPVEVQRGILSVFVDSITVRPTTKGTRWAPERVEVAWR
jgi:hypothetical protein